ncbi:hypothetical protein Tco_1142285 [Tanacetum coccineum]
MSSITAQQTKLDLELVPKEKRLEIGKCNGRLNPRKKQREPTFQVVLDALALTPCYSAFLITADVPEICPRVHGQNFDELPTDEDIVSFFKELGHTREIKTITDIVVDQMHQPWRTFATIVNRSLSRKTTGLDKLRLSRAQILWGIYYKKNVDYVELLWEDFTYQIDNRDKTISKRNKIGMHTSRDDYLINTLRFVSTKEESQIYGARLPKSMTSLEMPETKAYKTHLGYATGVTPPKKALKFNKPTYPKLSTVPASPEEPTKKSKRVKRPAKKSSNASTSGVVIRETPMKSLSKKKEKMIVEKRKGIDFLSEVGLTEEAQYEEIRKKNMRDFYKTHPSGSGTVTKIAPSAAKFKPCVTNEGAGVKLWVLDVTGEESTKSEAECWGKDEDDNNNEHDSRSEGSDQERDSDGSESDQEENEEDVEDDEEEKDDKLVKTSSNFTDDEDETKIKDKAKGDEDEGMDYTYNQFDDDVDLRLNEPVTNDEGFIQKEGTDAEMINVQQENENSEIALNQVIEDAYVPLSTVLQKTEVLVTRYSHSSDLASKFLNFLNIPHTIAEIVSPIDVHVHHEVPSNQTPTFLIVTVSVITESSLIFTTVIPQSLPSFTLPLQQSTPTPPPITKATNPLSTLSNFISVFQFNNKVTTLEKEVAELKKNDPLNTQVTTLVDEHRESRLGATRDEFMSYLLASITARITEQVKSQLPQILPKEVSNFAPLVIKSIVIESVEHAVLAKEYLQPKSTYEVAATLTEFELKKILIDKMDESQSYLTATEHKECYDRLIKSYDLDKSLFSTYDKVYSLKRSQKDKDNDKDPFAGSDQGLKKRKARTDAEPITGLKTKYLKSGSSKGAKSQSKYSGNSIQSEEPEFEVADFDITQDQEENLGDDDEEPKGKVNLKDLKNLLILIGMLPRLHNKDLLKAEPAFKLLKGTHSNYTELEYDFEECYKALTEKLDWDNPEGGDYPFDLTKPLPLVMNENHQMVPVEYFFNNNLKYLQGGISTMTYTTSITKTKAAQYDLPCIEDMAQNIWRMESTHDVYSTKRILAVTWVENRLTNLSSDDVSDFAIAPRMFTKIMVIHKRVEDLQLGVESYQKKINVTKPETTRPGLSKKDPYTPYQDPQGFIYVDTQVRNRLMRSDELN